MARARRGRVRRQRWHRGGAVDDARRMTPDTSPIECNEAGRGTIEETVAPLALGTVSDWIRTAVK